MSALPSPSRSTRAGDHPEKVALCVTCLVDQFLPDIGVAALRLLRRAGYEVAFPPGQTCCGQPFFNSGFRDQAVELARHTIEVFEPYDAVVLPSGSCTTMIRHEYPHLFDRDDPWHARAVALAARTHELTEFLVKMAGWQPPRRHSPGAVTYHDSCHMCRLLEVKGEPRHLLAGAGCELVEMAESDRCCGFGGLFSLHMPEVANAMTAEKLRQARATGAAHLVTADPGCLMQMQGLAEEGGPEAIHIAVLLEQLTR